MEDHDGNVSATHSDNIFIDGSNNSRIATELVFDTDNSYLITENITKITTREIEDYIYNMSKDEMEISKQRNNSSSKLVNKVNPIIISKENLNNFFTRLASVSKFSSGRKPEIENDEYNNNLILKMMKNKRETALLDAKLNVQEILDDKNHLLLTEDNIVLDNSLNSSKDDLLMHKYMATTGSIEDKNVELKDFDTFNKENENMMDLKKMDNMCPEKMKDMIENFKKPAQINSSTTKVSSTSSKINNKNRKSYGKSIINTDKKEEKKDSLHKLHNIETVTNSTTKSTLNSVKLPNKNKSPLKKINPSASLKPISRDTLNNLNSTKKIATKNSIGLTTARTPINSKSPMNPFSNKNKTPIKQPSKISVNKKSLIVIPKNLKNKNSSSKNTIDTIKQMNTNNSKKDILNTSTITNKKNESNKNLSTVKKKTTSLSYDFDARFSTEMNIIEEYEYSKILLELRAIFGEELQFFDENSKIIFVFTILVLFSNLDELSNKGLIKGLIKLCHSQDKAIKNYDFTLNKIRAQYKSDMTDKDKTIKHLNDELSKLKLNLKGLINEPYNNLHTEAEFPPSSSSKFINTNSNFSKTFSIKSSAKTPNNRLSMTSKSPIKKSF